MAALFFDQKELIEDKLASDAVQDIQEFLANKKLPKLRVEQILLFLLSCDNDKDFAKETIKLHYQIKKDYPKYFTNWNIERSDFHFEITKCLDVASLPRTEEGTAVLYFRQYNARLYCIESIVSIAPMVIDSVIYDERYDDPPTGLTVIWDMRGYSLAHLMKCRYTPVRALLQYVQYGLPLKLKSVHIVNAPSFVDKVLAFFKPFLKQSVFELIRVHPLKNESMEEFYKCVNRKYLPQELGGDQPPVQDLLAEVIKRLKNLRSRFEDDEKQWNI